MLLTDFDALTFDCYGTLIDWESGMVEALKRALPIVHGERSPATRFSRRTRATSPASSAIRPQRDIGTCCQSSTSA